MLETFLSKLSANCRIENINFLQVAGYFIINLVQTILMKEPITQECQLNESILSLYKTGPNRRTLISVVNINLSMMP